MGIRVHLFQIWNQEEWIQLKRLLAAHNTPHKGTDEEIVFSCYLQYEDGIFVECIAHTTNQKSIDYFESKLEDRYFPPWGKPFWYNDASVSVSKLKNPDVSFVGIRASFPEKAPITISDFLAKEEIEFPICDEFEWNIPD
jgi:hypothetical protein